MKKLSSGHLKYIVLAALVYLPVFGHLDALPIRIWGEARLAINGNGNKAEIQKLKNNISKNRCRRPGKRIVMGKYQLP